MSLFDDTYKTIEEPSSGIYRDKGSKFIAYLFPFSEENQLKEQLAQLRDQHPKARHWCYAYRLTTDPSVFRVNDDGEPSGSAGRPILNTLLSHELTQVLAVVVRYFGGTLLGIPGLIHAYKTATVEAIAQSNIITKRLEEQYRLDFTYASMHDVMHLIKQENLEILKQKFDLECSIVVKIPKAQVTQILNKIEKIPDMQTCFLGNV